jgi:hypothetical protein
VEDVEAEPVVARPVVHRLEGDQRESSIDGELGDLAILHTVRPPPEHLTFAQLGQVFGLRLGQHHHVRSGDDLVAGNDAAHERRQPLVGEAELLAVARLQDDAVAQGLIDPLEVQGMDRQSPLGRLA